MRHFVFILWSVSFCFAGCIGSAPRAPESPVAWLGQPEFEPVQYQLDNGLTVILQEDHSAPVVAVQAWVNVGSADERPDQAGLAHVHEHMLFKGTARRGVGEIAAEVEASGGSINAWTSYDQTVYHIVMASRFADNAVDILADAIQSSSFEAGELERELQVIQEEISRSEDMPSRTLSQNLFSTSYREHPYGMPIIGTRESVDSFTRDHVLEFFQSWYRPANITFVVVGDFEPEHMRALLERQFGGMNDSPTPRQPRAQEPQQAELRTTLEFRDIQEGHLAVGLHVPGLRHDDIPALELLAILLGQGESSMLFREIKRNRELATSVYAYLYTPREPGILMIGANLATQENPVDPLESLDAILTETFNLRHTLVSSQDLERARTMLRSETIYERETVQGRANRMGYFHVVAEDLAFETRFLEMVEEVTPADIQRVAQQYLTPTNMTVAFVMPEASEAELTDETVTERTSAAFERSEALAANRVLVPDEHGVVRHVFPNGLTLLIQTDHAVPIVSTRAVFPGGLRFESEASNGVNNLVADLLTMGTETRTAEDISREIEGMAGALSGFSGRNSIGLQMDVLSRDYERALALMGDCMANSTFPEDEIERLRREVLAELIAQHDDLAGSAFRQMNRTLFSGHPLQYEALGTRESVQALTREQLLDYYRGHLRPSAMTLSVVGDVTPEQVIQAVQREFDVNDRTEVPAVQVPELTARPREEIIGHRDRQQAHLVFGFLGVGVDDADRWPLEVLAAILSGQGGRLFLELRDRRSLAYSVGAFSMVGLDGGYFATYIATSPGRVAEAIESMESELNRIRDELASEDEIGRAQRYLVGQREISFQRVSNRAAYLAFDEAYGLGYADHYAHAERILAVTPEEVQRVAREYLNLETGVLSIIRPGGGSDASEESSEQGSDDASE